MAQGLHIRIDDIPAAGHEVGDDELASVTGGRKSQYSATIDGLPDAPYCDQDAGF